MKFVGALFAALTVVITMLLVGCNGTSGGSPATSVSSPPSSSSPSITLISPAAGSTGGGTVVTIAGENFQAGATVSFGGTAASAVNVSDSTTVKATTPAHGTGFVSVVLTNPDGQTATAPTNFMYSAGQTGPPTSYASRTDTSTLQVVTIPNVGNLVGANTVVTDPDFNNSIVRITDANTNPSLVNHSYDTTQSGSADQNLWNTNSTFFVIGDDGGGVYPFQFDPTTLQAKRLYVSNYPSTGGLRGSGSPAWSYDNADLLYVLSKDGDPTISNADFSDLSTPPTPTTIYNFATSSSKCLPSGFNGGTTWSSDLTLSVGDSEFGAAFSDAGGQNTGVYAVVYRVGQGCSYYNTSTGAIGGDWGTTGTVSTSDRYPIHNVRLSKDGEWMVIDPGGCLTGVCAVRYFWQVGTTNVTACRAGSDCSGHWTEGYTHWINDPNEMITAGRLFSDPATYSYLVAANPSGLIPPWDTHQSWNNADTSDSTPVFATTASATKPFPSAYYNEILATATDGSGTVWRFCHTFITGPLPGNSYNFDAQYGIGSVSQDGRFFIFTSDWMSSLGSTSGGATCLVGSNCRSDVFVVQLQ